MFDLRRLHHLLAVVEHGNFSRAAKAVHLTQPALSRSIQSLESEAGAVLVQRQRGAVEPTEIGRLLLRHAEALVAGARDLERDLQLARGLDLGELRVGVGPFGAAALIGPVVGQLSRTHPRLQVKLIVAPWQELPERARAREVDLVIAELGEIRLLEDFEHRALSAHRTRFVCRSGHPLAALEAPGAQDVFTYPLAAPRLPPRASEALLKAMPAHVRERARRAGLVTIECDSAAVLKEIVLASDAVSNMPQFMVENEIRAGLLVALPGLDIGVRLQFGAAWLARRTLGGAAGKLVDLLAAHDAAIAASSADRIPGPQR